MKHPAVFLLALCLLALSACGEVAAPTDPSPVPPTLILADLDRSAIAAVEIYSGITGERQRFTDTETVNALSEAITAIEGHDPISSQGYYATFYVLTLCGADDEPLLALSLVKPSDHQYFVGHGVYETINGFAYSALYTVDAAQFDALLALCDARMGVTPITSVPASS